MSKQTKKLLINVLFFGTAIGLGVYLSLKPWQHFQEQQTRKEEAVSEMKRVEKERIDLMKRHAQHDSSLGKEELARQRGYRKPEEVPFEE
jgi:hypothetical protein